MNPPLEVSNRCSIDSVEVARIDRVVAAAGSSRSSSGVHVRPSGLKNLLGNCGRNAKRVAAAAPIPASFGEARDWEFYFVEGDRTRTSTHFSRDGSPLTGTRRGQMMPITRATIVGRTVIAGDGQVSMGNTVMKPNARKVRRIGEGGNVIAGFAGATADAFTLFERLEKKLEQHRGQLMRAAVELAKDWRTDKYLRNLEALMIVADAETLLVLTGNGDVLEPEGGVMGIGSGGNYALAAARALLPDERLSAREIVERSLNIAGDICIFTNRNITILEL